ncbi:unnamed protein product [Closterium sp. NIES-65]|nr:unnamed protein product [Closterium sp. NIES-65]
MSRAKEEALGASGKDLAVDDLPKGMFHHLADPADLPAAKKPCMDPGSRNAPNSSPSTSSGSAPAMPAYSPAPLAAAALTAPPIGLAPTQAATAAAAPNTSATRATAYASVGSASILAPALPASLFTSPTPGAPPPQSAARAHGGRLPDAFPPTSPHGSHRPPPGSRAGTVGDPYRMARRVYGCLLFSWPSQEDAAAFRKLFPLTLKVSNSRPLLLKVFEDRFAAFTAAKAAGAPTLSIRNVPLDFDPEDIRAYLLGSTEPDGSHWLADLTDFHRASDPYEDTYITHLAGLPVATPDDPDFERILSRNPNGGEQTSHAAQLFQPRVRTLPLTPLYSLAAPPPAFLTAAGRPRTLTPTPLLHSAPAYPLPRSQHTLPDLSPPPVSSPADPLHSHELPPPAQPPPTPASPHSLPVQPHPLGPIPHLAPGLWPFAPHCTHPTPLLTPHSCPPPPTTSPTGTLRCLFPLSLSALSPPSSPTALSFPCPLYGWAFFHPCSLPSCPPPFSNALPHASNILGNHAAPTTFRNDPGLLYVGLDDKVETWTCALCDFTCGAALDSAMVHIQSAMHTSRVKAMAHRPAAKEAFGPWSAQKPSVATFLRG